MFASLLLTLSTAAQNPVELGDVRWIRDFEQGVARARETDKPMLVLFQEVPG